MSVRSFCALALLCCATLAACGDGSGILGTAGPADAATVRFVNASPLTLDLVTGGAVTSANANIAPGGGIACFSVPDPSLPGLAVRESGTATDLSGFTPLFSSNGRYTLVAFPGAAGLVRFINVPNAFIPISGRSALRVLNASTALGSVDVYISAPGAALGTASIIGVPFGASSGSFDVAAGTSQVRLTSSGSTSIVYDAGSQVLEAEKSYTLIVSSATAAILVPDC